jgi:2',3'-cyclic-nucleotide 2'-phosphodiesterase (5'-nucleotidase family)
VVSANVVDRRTGDVYGRAAGARRFVVRELAGVRIGLTGLLTARGPRSIPGSPHGEVLDPAEAMREIVPRMRAAGAQLIVILSHLDTRTEAQQLARAVPGIDLILCTHIGTPRSEPEKVNSTVISTPEWGLNGFGRLDLTLRGGRIASYGLHTYNASTAAPVDPAVAAILNQAGIRS